MPYTSCLMLMTNNTRHYYHLYLTIPYHTIPYRTVPYRTVPYRCRTEAIIGIVLPLLLILIIMILILILIRILIEWVHVLLVHSNGIIIIVLLLWKRYGMVLLLIIMIIQILDNEVQVLVVCGQQTHGRSSNGTSIIIAFIQKIGWIEVAYRQS